VCVCVCICVCFLSILISLINRKTNKQTHQGDLDSYLIEITRDILRHKSDDDQSKYTVDLVLDLAGQKGWFLV
jgi:6-phosphogluconate dehydrogenase